MRAAAFLAIALASPSLAEPTWPDPRFSGSFAHPGQCDSYRQTHGFRATDVTLGPVLCDIRSVSATANGYILDLTACWSGGEASGDRRVDLTPLTDNTITMHIEDTVVLHRCPA